ncbi:hypothetical protein [Hansschlegelia plantiphila]|nr:hypothetical protein [Hansschlegelia plantiphila]
MPTLELNDVEALIESVASASPPLAGAEDDGLAAVAREAGFGDRYRLWRGRSGRRYLVTVMPLGEAMRVENGVVMLVAIAADGSREIMWAGESGSALPGLALAPGVRIEAHVHLLAVSDESRAEALSDLVNDTQTYSSVLTVRAAASHESVGSATPSRSSSRAVFTT